MQKTPNSKIIVHHRWNIFGEGAPPSGMAWYYNEMSLRTKLWLNVTQ